MTPSYRTPTGRRTATGWNAICRAVRRMCRAGASRSPRCTAGHVFPVELSITETHMDDRRFFVPTLRDLTRQKAAEADLQQARATLQAFLDHAPMAILINRLGAGGLQDQVTKYSNDRMAHRAPPAPADRRRNHHPLSHPERHRANHPYRRHGDRH